jgi:hypothetical protein
VQLLVELGEFFELFFRRSGWGVKRLFVEGGEEIEVRWWIHPCFNWLVLIDFSRSKPEELRFSSLPEGQNESRNGTGRLSVHRIDGESQTLCDSIFIKKTI